MKLDLSNLHYKPHYRTQGCVIRENIITAPIKDPIKDTLVPLQTNFNANGSVRWRTSLYLDLFHWPMGKNYGNHNGVCRYFRALLATTDFSTHASKNINQKPLLSKCSLKHDIIKAQTPLYIASLLLATDFQTTL